MMMMMMMMVGQVYKTVIVGLSRKSHCLQEFCASFGANLASVHNILEYSFLQRLINTAGHSFAWIGGYYFEVCSTSTAVKGAST